MESKPIRILLVDDNQMDYLLTRELLAEMDDQHYELEWKATFEEALDAMRRHEHDLYLVDYRLGERDGLELLEAAQQAGLDAPFILLTGLGDRDIDLKAMEAGAADYLVKNEINARMLERSIRYALGQKRVERELRMQREQIRRLAAHQQAVREEERKLMAREVHDVLGQAMTVLKMNTVWLHDKLQDHPDLHARTTTMLELIDETIEVVRRINFQLRPGILDDLGISAALEWQAFEFQKRTGITCVFEQRDEVEGIDNERSTAIFRIFQEILTNVARHAQADTIRIWFGIEDEALQMCVSDNGIGIRKEEIAGTRSMGLFGMRERAQSLGGNVQVTGAPGEGTTVILRVPVPSNEKQAV